jgi:nucleoside-diphosphate-sugar epimerase
MRVLILGGDGYCGWPTTLHLSPQGWYAGRVRPELLRPAYDWHLAA